MPEPHPYVGQTFALLTQHAKQTIIGPLFAEAFAATVSLVSDFDTDTLGSFSRLVPREASQLDTARRKAAIACERSRQPLGLGSEGAFSGLSNFEVVLLLDATRGLEIAGRATAPALHGHAWVSTLHQLEEAAARFGFPAQGLVLRPDDEGDRRVRYGSNSFAALGDAFGWARAQASTGRVLVEPDRRAHQNPSRQATIAAATRDLLARMRCLCASCGAPGYGLAATLPGLRCRACGLATSLPASERFECVSCDAFELRPATGQGADPTWCDDCNP